MASDLAWMKVGEVLPQVDGRHPRKTQDWQEKNQADQSGSNQPDPWRAVDRAHQSTAAVLATVSRRDRWSRARPGNPRTDRYSKPTGMPGRGVTYGSHRRRRLDRAAAVLSIPWLVSSTAGSRTRCADVLERMVRQRVAEGPILLLDRAAQACTAAPIGPGRHHRRSRPIGHQRSRGAPRTSAAEPHTLSPPAPSTPAPSPPGERSSPKRNVSSSPMSASRYRE